MKNKRPLLISLIIIGTIVAGYLIYLLVRDLWPLVDEIIKNAGDEQQTVNYVKAYGARGVPILLGIEIILGMINLIPAAPVHILAGLCYGVLWGSLIAVSGIAIGNALIFLIYRRLHRSLGFKVKSEEKRFLSVRKLDKMKHPEIIAMIIYALPILPNLIAPYIFARTKISFWRYIASITLAGLPWILALTWTGKALASGDWSTVVLLALILLIILAALIVNRKRIIETLSR